MKKRLNFIITEFRDRWLLSMSDDLIKDVSEVLKSSKNLVVLTGAGISAESGIPTFRGKDGLWKKYRAEELATPEAFRKNPGLVWEWYNFRREIIHSKKPNNGHIVLSKWENKGLFDSFAIITQNVDGFHIIAGNKNVFEIHGNIWKVRCTSCGKEEFNYEVPLKNIPPQCSCGGLLRPGVVWFGESLPSRELQMSFEALKLADVLLVVGTSGIVYPAASVPYYAKDNGAKIIEVNISETPITKYADYFLKGKSGEILPLIFEEMSK